MATSTKKSRGGTLLGSVDKYLGWEEQARAAPTATPVDQGVKRWLEGVMGNIRSKFPARFRTHREGVNLTPEQLADLAGVPPGEVEAIERGERFPTRETAEKLCGVLDAAAKRRRAG